MTDMDKKTNRNYDALKLENQLCFPLYAAAREVIKQYRPFLDELGITYTQYVTMMVFWEEKSLSVKELGQKLFLDSGTLTPVLKSLEKKGFLLRQRSKEDERVLIVKITPEGEALRDRATGVPGAVSSCIRISPEEAVQLHSLLYKVLDSIGEN